MFDKKIEFSAHEDYFALKEDYPIPTKLNIPEWFKKLKHDSSNLSVKGCMPFLDSLTSGYLLKIPQDLHIVHNVDSKDEKGVPFKDAFQHSSFHKMANLFSIKHINLNTGHEIHDIKQLEGSPLIEKNKNLPFHKILNPWKIKTPKGYSCLFLPPLNNGDDRFSIIPGIVDTDIFPNEVNFPIVVNGDKYSSLDTVIEKGTPYVQVIPFKRDSWKMEFKSRPQKEVWNSRMFYFSKLINIYKQFSWIKKSWK